MIHINTKPLSAFIKKAESGFISSRELTGVNFHYLNYAICCQNPGGMPASGYDKLNIL